MSDNVSLQDQQDCFDEEFVVKIFTYVHHSEKTIVKKLYIYVLKQGEDPFGLVNSLNGFTL